MTEVEKLVNRLVEQNTTHFGVTTAYELGLTDKRPTAEEIAKALNDVDEHLSKGNNKAIAILKGEIALKSDSIMCLKNRKQLVDYAPYFINTALTNSELQLIAVKEKEIEELKQRIERLSNENS